MRSFIEDAKTVLPKTWAGLVACLFWLLSMGILSQAGGIWPFIAFLVYGIGITLAYLLGAMTAYVQGRIDVMRAQLRYLDEERELIESTMRDLRERRPKN